MTFTKMFLCKCNVVQQVMPCKSVPSYNLVAVQKCPRARVSPRAKVSPHAKVTPIHKMYRIINVQKTSVCFKTIIALVTVDLYLRLQASESLAAKELRRSLLSFSKGNSIGYSLLPVTLTITFFFPF